LKPITRLIAAILAIAAPAAASADVPSVSYNWSNVVIGGGGFSPNIVFSPAEKGLAYLRTDVGGVYRWDAQQQRWLPLEDSQWQDSYFGIESVAPDPRDPNVVYLAAGMYYGAPSAIMRSADRGTTWAITPVPFQMGGNEDGRGMGERLAVDPQRTSTLFFGSRHDGLWRSDDSGKSWRKVPSFPWKGLGPPRPHQTHGGVAFVLFDPATGTPGAASRTIYAGVADPTEQHLFRSSDSGETWAAVAGGPSADMLPVKAAIGTDGTLYVDYCTGIGPNGVADGAVWKLGTRSGKWTGITPVHGEDSEGGYMGLSVDRARPGRVAVSTVDRWGHHDTVWLSNDAGAHWSSLREHSRQDFSAVPFLGFDKPESTFGGWISGLAFDPFDGGTLAYTTGGTVLRTADALKPELLWKPWVKGVEETVPLDLISPTAGAHLISGIGDVHGFVHDRLDVSPPQPLLNPNLAQTDNVDWAGLAPNVLVRSASGYVNDPEGVSLGWSGDGGHNWRDLIAPPVPIGSAPPARIDVDGQAPIGVSADGKTFVVSGPVLLATADRGRTWWKPRGLPQNVRAIAEKTDPRVWYAVDYSGGKIFVSRDSAHSFQQVPAKGLPADISDSRPYSRENQPAVLPRPGTAGELWLITGGHFYRSTDFARSFSAIIPKDPIFRDMLFVTFGLGKAAPGSSFPAIYGFGIKPTFGGLYRSIDGGATWVRINDDAHQWGLRYRTITGDPRLFGRVYVGTDGRGIFYGDPLH
jgi:xyloglucan-specific exo-beta-1,4-glucanase